jgi:hypothetical protein
VSSKSRILDKLAKLLALAKSPNAHEAATAQSMADKLMSDHGISQDDVETHTSSGFYELPMGATGWKATWKFALVTAAARYCGCEAIALRSGSKRKVRLVGEKADVEQAAALFAKLMEIMSELEKDMASKVAESDELEHYYYVCGARQCSDSYRRGLVAGIIERLGMARPERFGRRRHGFGNEPAGAAGEADSSKKSWSWDPREWFRKKDDAKAPDGKVLPPSKDLATTAVKQEGHREKINQKYKPRMRPLALDEVSSPDWYWLGHDDAFERVVITETEPQVQPGFQPFGKAAK